jgi:hypothetical protein
MKIDYTHIRARTRDFPRDELYWNFRRFMKVSIYDFIFQHIRRPLESVRLARHIEDSIEGRK